LARTAFTIGLPRRKITMSETQRAKGYPRLGGSALLRESPRPIAALLLRKFTSFIASGDPYKINRPLRSFSETRTTPAVILLYASQEKSASRICIEPLPLAKALPQLSETAQPHWLLSANRRLRPLAIKGANIIGLL
jgi:hypothetical protein